MIYIHVPFCKSFCNYCGFYSELYHSEDSYSSVDDYVDALKNEIAIKLGSISRYQSVNTLYIGGGTPSVLPLDCLREIVSVLSDYLSTPFSSGSSLSIPSSSKSTSLTTPIEEFTIELNPEDVVTKSYKYLEALLELGVNRVSMGVQSLDDGVLRWMNRRHNAATAQGAYNMLEEVGFENISIDLIFGLPSIKEGQKLNRFFTNELWKKTIESALNISYTHKLPKHISAYQLSIDENSALEGMLRKGDIEQIDEENAAKQYDILCKLLKEAGYNHYEISNFALEGYEAKHNSAYWDYVPYIGLGPAAHSFSIKDGEYKRSWNEASLDKYIQRYSNSLDKYIQTNGNRQCNESSGVNKEDKCGACVYEIGSKSLEDTCKTYELESRNDSKMDLYEANQEILKDEQIMLEKLMLGLRTAKGVGISFIEDCIKKKIVSNSMYKKYLQDGVLIENSSYNSIRIAESCFFISDKIISSLIL